MGKGGTLSGPSSQHLQDAAVEPPPQGGTSQNCCLSAQYPPLQLSYWWSAASVFPMVAGALGPVALAFSICALVVPWQQYPPANAETDNTQFVEDPPWLTTVNAIQLAAAAIANLFLLMNMGRQIRFTIAQPITIAGWYISVICLVTLLSIVSGPRLKDAGHPEQDFVRSQAFYYALWAAILYFVDALLMSVTFWGSLSGHYSKNFNLTPSQRMLMVQSLIFVVHLLLGALVFSNIENWQYLDAVYWADATILTVGFGDFPVTSDLGRALLFPYALLGIVILGLIIASIRGIIVERPGTDDNMALDKLERRRLEFELIRKIERRAAFRQKWLAFVTSACVWFLLLFVGAAIFWKCEKPYQGWTYYDSYYFCYVSLTTIGYGDLTPVSNAGNQRASMPFVALCIAD
ncbi:Potassium channel [Coniochaeta hoffmannii]|uniref:Potassium channel n=1 Tax=Coniochaeta hoffmannii TaxID=91930 RepID=A0AA38SM87_9PEZI|nr:Potassium channel [Coniochaeta hoffmannii]